MPRLTREERDEILRLAMKGLSRSEQNAVNADNLCRRMLYVIEDEIGHIENEESCIQEIERCAFDWGDDLTNLLRLTGVDESKLEGELADIKSTFKRLLKVIGSRDTFIKELNEQFKGFRDHLQSNMADEILEAKRKHDELYDKYLDEFLHQGKALKASYK